MRLLLFLAYYGIAFLMGFMLRGRFDVWMYSKPHMQKRLVIWAADTVSYVEQGGNETILPPDTTDADAFSPVLGESRVGRLVRRRAGEEDADLPVPEGLDAGSPGAVVNQGASSAEPGGPAPPPVDPA